jgi:hypothetical protein
VTASVGRPRVRSITHYFGAQDEIPCAGGTSCTEPADCEIKYQGDILGARFEEHMLVIKPKSMDVREVHYTEGGVPKLHLDEKGRDHQGWRWEPYVHDGHGQPDRCMLCGEQIIGRGYWCIEKRDLNVCGRHIRRPQRIRLEPA